MLIIPAIDIKDGKCVRLKQGRMDQETIYSDNPLDIAKRWRNMGVSLIHVVDLDGAVSGRPVNKKIIEDIINNSGTPIQVGGGIRDLDLIDSYIGIGAERVVLGTSVIGNPGLLKEACSRYPKRISVGIDAEGGMVAIDGWKTITERKAIDLAKEIEGFPLWAIIYTDISRDGMLSGPNIDGIAEMARNSKIPVIASGGVSGIDDIKRLKGIRPEIKGVIIGKALYSGTLDLREAIAIAGEN
ncbi:MAG: 1-(5-phosphoribosyl)-5-[(5-phosphoribosylamino)methylideneamino]imidazole-4-carboxamide isomerase [Nitrospirota bacterium]